MEDIPTASGGKPSSSVVIPPRGGSGGGGGAGSSSTSSGISSIPSSVSNKLDRDGNSGKQADTLARATSQASGSKQRARPAVQAAPSAPSRQVLDALEGSTGGGGLGVLLPVILIGSLVIVSAVGLLRRRRSV